MSECRTVTIEFHGLYLYNVDEGNLVHASSHLITIMNVLIPVSSRGVKGRGDLFFLTRWPHSLCSLAMTM
jgi:hypothetical protein